MKKKILFNLLLAIAVLSLICDPSLAKVRDVPDTLPPDAVVSYVELNLNPNGTGTSEVFRANVNTESAHAVVESVFVGPSWTTGLIKKMKVVGDDVHFAISTTNSGFTFVSYIKLPNNSINAMITENIPGLLNKNDTIASIDLIIGMDNGIEVPVIVVSVFTGTTISINIAVKIAGWWRFRQGVVPPLFGQNLFTKLSLNSVVTNGNITGVKIAYYLTPNLSTIPDMFEISVFFPNLNINVPINLSQPSHVWPSSNFENNVLIWEGDQILAFTSDVPNVQYKVRQSKWTWGLPIILPTITPNASSYLADMVEHNQLSYIITNEGGDLNGHFLGGGQMIGPSFNIALAKPNLLITYPAVTDTIRINGSNASVLTAFVRRSQPTTQDAFVELYEVINMTPKKLMNIGRGYFIWDVDLDFINN